MDNKPLEYLKTLRGVKIAVSHYEEHNIRSGDSLIAINNHPILDILDYKYFSVFGTEEENISFELLLRSGATDECYIVKLDCGFSPSRLEFGNYLLDNPRRCSNRCVFCFIDRLPPLDEYTLRDALYFKDDDGRLSFLQGNYVTLTNFSRREAQRIKDLKIPLNISLHTTDEKIREQMLGNKNAGNALRLFYEFIEARVPVNIQNVLCAGINDGEVLRKTLEDLVNLIPFDEYSPINSVAFVPVGLTKHFNIESYNSGFPKSEQVSEFPERCKLRIFTEEEAGDIIDIIDSYGEIALVKCGERIFYPSDEFFYIAKRDVPPYEYYNPFFEQYENGVGMWRCFEYEFGRAITAYTEKYTESAKPPYQNIGIITGKTAAYFFRRMFDLYAVPYTDGGEKTGKENIEIFEIRNEFFGETVNVSGLLTCGDIIKQLNSAKKNSPLPQKILFPINMLRNEGKDENGNIIPRYLFLDDLTLTDLKNEFPETEFAPSELDGDLFFNRLVSEI